MLGRPRAPVLRQRETLGRAARLVVDAADHPEPVVVAEGRVAAPLHLQTVRQGHEGVHPQALGPVANHRHGLFALHYRYGRAGAPPVWTQAYFFGEFEKNHQSCSC